MRTKLALALATLPTVTGTFLASMLLALPAQAASPVDSSTDDPVDAIEAATCSVAPGEATHASKQAQMKNFSHSLRTKSGIPIAVEYPELAFTAAESDAAVRLFGCDCPACIGTLRVLRAQITIEELDMNSQGHCLTNLQGRVSPEEVEAVLDTLDDSTPEMLILDADI